MFISISMDLVGSTAAKRRIREIDPVNVELRYQSYTSLLKRFSASEHRFYSALFESQTKHPEPLDIGRFFVVKGIGDEQWMVYNLVDPTVDEFVSIGARILNSAFDAANSASSLTVTSELDGPDFDPHAPLPKRIENIDMEIKFYIDLVEDYIDAASVRQDMLTKHLHSYVNVENPSLYVEFENPAVLAAAHNLNLGYIANTKRYSRADPIGNDVDHFFRCSKAALPGIVTVGDRLFRRLGLIEEQRFGEVCSGAAIFPHCYANPHASSFRGHQTFWRQRDLEPSELKGIDHGYTTWRLASEFTVRNLHTKPLRKSVKEAKQLFPASLVHPTKRG